MVKPIRLSDLITSEDKPVMCCMCFEPFAIEDLHMLPDGKREDVCKDCAIEDREGVIRAIRERAHIRTGMCSTCGKAMGPDPTEFYHTISHDPPATIIATSYRVDDVPARLLDAYEENKRQGADAPSSWS